MPSYGPRSPGTIVNDGSFGTLAWGNPSYAGASDDSYANRSSAVDGNTNYLKASSFNFTIPAGEVIAGILVEIERSKVGAGGVQDERVRIVKAGNIGATEKASAGGWPSTDAYKSYGGATDKWGETWAAGDINDSGFGCALAARVGIEDPSEARVDHMRITVFTEDARQHVASQVV